MIEDLNVDLHLLRSLDVLLTERSVTQAAKQMNMSQPGMSNALARLRTLFDDPLLVRTPKGMIPTRRAEEIHETVRDALDRIEGVIAGNAFDPRTATLNVTIAMSDYAALLLLPNLLKRLENEAPGVTITVRPPDPMRVREWLEEGVGELVIGFLPDATETLKSSVILRGSIVCIVREGHPEVRGDLDAETFASLRHVVFGSAFTGLSTLEHSLDETLKAAGIVRQIGVRIPSIQLSPHVVANTDMVATLPKRFVDRYCQYLPLKVFAVPVEFPETWFAMLWHERTHRHEAMVWLREMIRKVARDTG
jgi:DNA-binding transcriptional LysR family regulator